LPAEAKEDFKLGVLLIKFCLNSPLEEDIDEEAGHQHDYHDANDVECNVGTESLAVARLVHCLTHFESRHFVNVIRRHGLLANLNRLVVEVALVASPHEFQSSLCSLPTRDEKVRPDRCDKCEQQVPAWIIRVVLLHCECNVLQQATS